MTVDEVLAVLFGEVLDFVITSVIEVDGKDRFTEHAQGRVYVHASSTMFTSTAQDAACVNGRALRTEVRPARWYQQYYQCGLHYGDMFQLLATIHALEGHDTVEAEVKLIHPSTSTGESRYLLHPTTLDAVLQLSIMAPHSSMLSSLRTGCVPVEIDRLTIWSQHLPMTGNLHATVRGTKDGSRTLLADSFVGNVNDESVLEICGLRLRALDQIASNGHGDMEPFSRLTWKPALDLLTNKQISSLYPPVRAGMSPDLDELAINQLIIFRETYPELFSNGSRITHLDRFLHWIRDKTSQVLAGQNLALARTIHCSTSQRLEVINELGAALKQTSSECRIMCHMYENLPAIFEGQKTGIQVALHGNLLSDLYENGDLLREGNRRLAQVVALLSHQNPGMAVLEVGAGTGSATCEILKALEGSSMRRRYSEYVYTDITSSFLSNAEKQFSAHKGVTFSTFDMEKPGAEQGFSRKFDLVVASNGTFVSRLVPDELMNERFMGKEARTRCTERTELSVLGHRPLQATKNIVGTDVPFYMEDKALSVSSLQSHEVQVKVKVRGFSLESLSPSLDDDGYAPPFGSFAGTVVAAGDGIDDLAPGANVYGLHYSNNGNSIRLKSSRCCSLASQTSLKVCDHLAGLLQLLTTTLQEIVSFTEAFCHASYALVHLARLQRNEVMQSTLFNLVT
ncbi:MAG: hypothetical protein Q9192_007730 [Flavoplaca navasiana]